MVLTLTSHCSFLLLSVQSHVTGAFPPSIYLSFTEFLGDKDMVDEVVVTSNVDEIF